MTRALGFDISFYQDNNYTPQKVDFQKMRDYGADFVIMRVGQNTWLDEDIKDYLRDSAKVDGLYRGTYWFYDARTYVSNQCLKYWNAIKDEGLEIPPVMDFETYSVKSIPTQNWSRSFFLSLIKEFLETMDDYYGDYTIFYTNPGWLYYLAPLPDWLIAHPLWLAYYGAEKDINLYGHTGWKIWQDGTPAIGLEVGVESKEIDRNWFNGTREQLEQWLGITQTMIDPLDLTVMSQKDLRWAGEKLGTSAVTIGGYGCLLTSVAMTCNYFGKDTDPGRLNKSLIEVNGYEQGNLLRYSSVSTIYPDILVDWNAFLTNPDDKDIDGVLKLGLPVIAQVDYKPDTVALEQHWVVIIGKDTNGYLIADPIDGQTVYLSRYGGKVYRMVVYYHKPIEQPMFKVRVIAKALNVRSEPIYKEDGSNIVGLLNEGDVVNVYEIADNGWYRIGDKRWISGNPDYTERIEEEQPEPEPELTIEQRVERLEKAVFGG
jgi:GH25 family lysozyme M1 (1,4-beta-N-acetylmuramidase)